MLEEERFGTYVPPTLALLWQQRLPDPRPEDNYELSDREDDSDREETRDRSQKRIPKWCDNYLQVLHQQQDVDPDTIFGCRVPKCSLEEIFTDAHYKLAGKPRPNRKRGSSADWRKDGLAPRDVREYKKKMGQGRSWNMSSRPIARPRLPV